MPLNTKTLYQIVVEMVSEWAGELGLQPSLTSGDPLLALMQAVGGEQMFIQYLCQRVLKFARASTATGDDLDSWMGDFAFLREPAKQAVGQVQFFLNIAKLVNVSIPVGAIVQVPGGAIQYQVIADTTQTNYNAQLQAYVIAAGQTSIVATVQALLPGTAYNVQPNQISQVVSTVTGVDGVFNQFGIAEGSDAETDQAFRNRFILWINSLSKNTQPSIGAAIMSVQQGLDFVLLENIDSQGLARNGYFTVVVDDGSGDTPQLVLDNIALAVEAVRGFTISYIVVRATAVSASLQLNVYITAGANTGTVLANVQAAIVLYVNELAIGKSLYLENLGQIAKDADPNVIAVQVGSKLINSAAADLTATNFQIIRTQPVHVNIGIAT